MNIERYERLIRILKNGNYKVDIRNLKIISNIAQFSKNKKPIYLKPVLSDRKGVIYRLVENKKRYEYGIHEIISVYLGKYIIDMVCNFIDGNKQNIHPSNFYWTDKKGGRRLNLSGDRSVNSKLSKQQVEEIKNAEFSRDRRSGSPINRLAEKLGVSRYTIINIRRGNGRKPQIKIRRTDLI